MVTIGSRRTTPPAQLTGANRAASYWKMFTNRLLDRAHWAAWREPAIRWAVLGLYLLMTIQFIGCYLFLGHPYIDLDRFGQGYERLPFQTRLLLAPLFHWAQNSPFMVRYASQLSMNEYFFPHGIGPAGVVQLWLDLPCVLVAGWVTVRLYQAATRKHLLGWLVFPFFLVLCTVTYILHVVQNYRFIYDMPSLMFFALGLYLIYFRKPVTLLVALFAVATWNRETTLLLIPFFLLSACVRRRSDTAEQGSVVSVMGEGPGMATVQWRRMLRPGVAGPAALMLAYWAAWHMLVFHLFRHNSSEYYPRISFNWQCVRRLRYYPQLFSAGGFLLPFVLLFRRKVRDAQLRAWLWMIPCWYAVMAVWGILVETRVFGELLPLIACAGMLIAEESLAATVQQRKQGEVAEEEDHERQARAA
jgi:hypothetical protein